MNITVNITLTRKPSASYTLFKGLRHGVNRHFGNQQLPDIRITWPEIKIKPKHLQAFCRICDIQVERTLPPLYFFSLAYPCMLRLIGQASFPFSMFKVLNTRTYTVMYQAISPDRALSVAVTTGACRHVMKGIEFDLHTGVTAGDDLLWENSSTFFVRGKSINESVVENEDRMPALTGGDTIGTWYLPAKNRFQFGRLSGDSNGLHYNAWYARLSGFERDFAQPLRVASKCIDMVASPIHMPLVLDLRYKGPVYYAHQLSLSYQSVSDIHRFDLYCQGNPRPCICGQMTSGPKMLENHVCSDLVSHLA